MSHRFVIVALTALLMVLSVSGCEDTQPDPKQREQVEQAIRDYLEALAEAYSSMDVSGLEPYATGKEIADVHRLLKDLAASGDRVESTLIGLEISSVSVFREVNATVSLLEVWDVRRYDAYTGREKGRNNNSVQNSLIQLRLMDGEWLVTARRVQQDTKTSRWNVTTPTPAVPLESE